MDAFLQNTIQDREQVGPIGFSRFISEDYLVLSFVLSGWRVVLEGCGREIWRNTIYVYNEKLQNGRIEARQSLSDLLQDHNRRATPQCQNINNTQSNSRNPQVVKTADNLDAIQWQYAVFRDGRRDIEVAGHGALPKSTNAAAINDVICFDSRWLVSLLQCNRVSNATESMANIRLGTFVYAEFVSLAILFVVGSAKFVPWITNKHQLVNFLRLSRLLPWFAQVMVRHLVLGTLVGSLIATGIAVQGCYVGASGGSDCNPQIPLKCCQCPWPEDCPPYAKEWPKMPPECDQYLKDGGVDGESSDSGTSSFCSSGTCVPAAPEAWTHVAFAMSWPALPPACPEDAPKLLFEGSPAPPDRACPACLCDAPEGSCQMPATWTVSSEICPGSNGVKTNFDAPTNWDGMCSNDNAIPKDKLCGGVPCVRSITISAPVIEEKPCVSHADGEVDLPVLKAWSDGPIVPTGRACASNAPLTNCSGQGCSKTNSTFGACIMHDGDEQCPEGWNGDRHVLYGHIDDARECTACGCDLPKGGTCQVKWRTFSDASCSTENAAVDIYAGMSPTCTDYMPGVALAGKTAELLDYNPAAG